MLSEMKRRFRGRGMSVRWSTLVLAFLFPACGPQSAVVNESARDRIPQTDTGPTKVNEGATEASDASPVDTPVPAASAFAHPGIIDSTKEIQFVKEKIRLSQQPWSSAFNALKGSRYSSKTYAPKPVSYVYDRFYSASGSVGHVELRNDAQAVYQHALMWAYTGDPEYARKSMEIIDAWATTLTKIDSRENGPLDAGWTGTDFARAADILKSTYPGWDTAVERKLVDNLFNRIYLPLLGDGRGPKGFNGNWSTSMTESLMAIAVFKNDRALFDTAVSAFRHRLPLYIFADGRSQELCRDLIHAQFGLGGLVQTAEIAHHQGVDLYSELDSRLLKGLEYHAAVLLGQTPPVAPGCGLNKVTYGASGWEIAYNHYKGRKGLSMPNVEVLIARHPVDGFVFHWGWGSVTHHGLGF